MELQELATPQHPVVDEGGLWAQAPEAEIAKAMAETEAHLYNDPSRHEETRNAATYAKRRLQRSS